MVQRAILSRFLLVVHKFKDSCILFHCTGGKDRTGMVAMLLLKLAGVDNETVIGDYAVTEENMKDIFPLQAAEMESRGLIVPPYILKS
jgi:protein-tyrosine phosphatase